MVAVATPASETAAGRLTGLLDALVGVAAELADAPVALFDDTDLAAAAVRVPAVAAQIDAALGSVLHEADRCGVAQRRGFRRIEQFVLAESNGAGVTVRAMVRRARWLRDFPAFDQAHAEGVLTVDHLEKIRRSLDKPRTHFLLRRDQQMLIDAAATCSFRDFERVCDYWKNAADPDGNEPQEQLAKTTFDARRRSDGMISLDGLLDPLTGAAFLTAWEKEKQKLRLRDEETSVVRREGLRGAEALMNLVTKGAARDDGSQPDPLINIVMSKDVADDAIRRMVERDPSPLPLDPNDVDGRCELIDGTPLHPVYAAMVMTIAALQRTVMTAKGRPLETSYSTRSFPKWMKYLAAIRSRGRCEEDGCDAPYSWLQGDHQHPRSRGGPTAWHNLTLRCRPHNLAKGSR